MWAESAEKEYIINKLDTKIQYPKAETWYSAHFLLTDFTPPSKMHVVKVWGDKKPSICTSASYNEYK